MPADQDYLKHRLEAIQKFYYIRYLLEEVRITFKNNINISMEDFEIDAKAGEISSIPRWIANILQDNNHIEIQNSDFATYVSRALNRERISKPHDLSNLDSDFYIRVNDYISRLNNSKESDREKENIVISLNSFVASRLEKIVKLAAASPLSPELEQKLSIEEAELYSLIHVSSREFKHRVVRKKEDD